MDEAIKQIEKSNIDLEPEILDAPAVRELLSRYARAKKLVSYGETMLAAGAQREVEEGRPGSRAAPGAGPASARGSQGSQP